MKVNSNQLLSVINKCHLNGLTTKFKIKIKDNVLSINFLTNNNEIVGEVIWNGVPLDDAILGIVNSDVLLSILKSVKADGLVDITYKSVNNKINKLVLASDIFKASYVTADVLLIKDSPEPMVPEDYDLECGLSEEFINNYHSISKIIGSGEEDLWVSVKDNNLTFALGADNAYSNNINISFPVNCANIPKILFPSLQVRNIFNSNSDLNPPLLTLYGDGLLVLNYQLGDLESGEDVNSSISSLYYILAKEVIND